MHHAAMLRTENAFLKQSMAECQQKMARVKYLESKVEALEFDLYEATTNAVAAAESKQLRDALLSTSILNMMEEDVH